MNHLNEIWNELTLRYSDNDELNYELWSELVNNYSASGRHYHNLTHLEYMMAMVAIYKNNLTDPDTVLFSIFYHDIIYDPKRQDNEERSAHLAHERLSLLGVPTGIIAQCQSQILASKVYKVNGDNDLNYFVDFDLAILGDTQEKYMEYKMKIRKEYSMYPDFLYKNGREKILQNFLDMERIFKTEVFYNNCEQQARENIKTELEELQLV